VSEARELTTEEVRKRFLENVVQSVRYWQGQTDQSVEARIEGVAFSILVALDGEAGDLPKFAVMPEPHPSEMDRDIANGDNYFPSLSRDGAGDIAGGLHDRFHAALQGED